MQYLVEHAYGIVEPRVQCIDIQGMTAYSSSKAGVIGLAKAVGKEYAETGITVNALAPAVIRTGVFHLRSLTYVFFQ